MGMPRPHVCGFLPHIKGVYTVQPYCTTWACHAPMCADSCPISREFTPCSLIAQHTHATPPCVRILAPYQGSLHRAALLHNIHMPRPHVCGFLPHIKGVYTVQP